MANTAETETVASAAIDEIVNARIAPDGPGVAVAVTRGGVVIHSKGYGVAQMEWRQRITPATVFGIGSVTKPFTATAILLLRAEGKLRLSDPITAFLPDYQSHGQIITIAHLLSHVSGIPNFVTLPGFWASDVARDHTHAEIRARFEELPLQFEPGERYSYNNSAYCLLGFVIERLSGVAYGEFIRERIFAPLGMNDSHYLASHAIIPRLAEGYAQREDDRGGWERAPYMSTTLQYAAGALGSTAEDMARWDLALRAGHPLDATTQAEMTTPTQLNDGRTVGYGMGWGLSTYRGRRVIHHSGGVPGYTAFHGRFLNDDLSIIVLSNRRLYDSAGLAQPIADVLLNLAPQQHRPATLEPAALARMAGVYENAIGNVLEITVSAGALRVSGELTADLVPLDETRCVSATSPDTQVVFEGAGPGGFERARVIVPFYWYEVTRVRA